MLAVGYQNLRMWKMFNLTNHDIDAIMVSALEGGIIYWCNKAEIADDYLGEDVSKQISRGDTLILYDDEEGESTGSIKISLLIDLRSGILTYKTFMVLLSLDDDVGTGLIDAPAADALFSLWYSESFGTPKVHSSLL